MDQPVTPDVAPALADLADQLGGPEAACEIVALYLDELPGRLGRVTGSDLEEAVRGAHSLKSASGLVGLADLSAASSALESALRGAPTTPRPDLVAEVARHAPPGRNALRAWLAGQG